MSRSILQLGCLLACLLFAAFATAASNDSSHERTQFGHNISVGPDEQVGEVTCFGCTVRVRGHVTGEVTTFGGSVILEDQGQIDSDVTVFGGDIRLNKDSKIAGDVALFGGHLRRDPDSSIGGDVSTFTGGIWLFLIFGLPFLVLGGFIALIIWLIRRFSRPAIPATA